MCLTIPGKIKSIKEGIAIVENGQRTVQVDLGLVFDAKAGDWILYATDRAVKLISEQDANEIISLLEDHYHPADVSKLSLEFKRIIFKVRSRESKNYELRIKNYGDGSHSVAGLSALDPRAPLSSRIAGPEDDSSHDLTKDEIEYLLNLKGKDNLETLFAEANSIRKEMIEDFVCIHGIIEFSNYCKNNCLYCGIRCDNKKSKRYRMTKDEIVETAKKAVELEGYKLLVLQSGEDDFYSDKDLIDIIREIKKQLRVFIFISVGERSQEFYKKAFMAGASGSLIRFETLNSELYSKLRPKHDLDKRIQSIKYQKKLGYYIASGSMVGLPGQTIGDIADDLLMIKKLGIPMISSGPYLVASGTPLADKNFQFPIFNFQSNSNDQMIKRDARIQSIDIDSGSQVAGRNDSRERIELFLKYISIARFMMPEIKIPVTTALETLDPESGRHRGLLAGANALMFNLTPEKFAGNYNIYDNKYREREKVWQKYGLFSGEESYEMLEERLKIDI